MMVPGDCLLMRYFIFSGRYEVILKLVPQSHHRILINIKKTQERKERKKKQDKEEDSEDDADTMAKARPETYVYNQNVSLVFQQIH